MTAAEFISSVIAFGAVVVSLISVYRAFFVGFLAEVSPESRVVLSHHSQNPSLVIGCELSNLGARSGAIDDMLLKVRHNPEVTTTTTEYWFKPYLLREDYNVYVPYDDNTDYRPFQSIFVPRNSSLIRYIVFIPLYTGKFSPESGNMELHLFSRESGKDVFREVKRTISFSITQSVADVWRDPVGQSLMIDTVENTDLRKRHIERSRKD
jgi:hypothetical protein